jgi:hypothetical protein
MTPDEILAWARRKLDEMVTHLIDEVDPRDAIRIRAELDDNVPYTIFGPHIYGVRVPSGVVERKLIDWAPPSPDEWGVN